MCHESLSHELLYLIRRLACYSALQISENNWQIIINEKFKAYDAGHLPIQPSLKKYLAPETIAKS